MNLKKIREACGLTQKRVAEDIGVSPTVYNRYEKGVREPSAEMLKTLAEYFSVSVDELLGVQNIKQEKTISAASSYIDEVSSALHQNPKLGLLFDRSRKMSDKDMDAVLGIVNAILKERDGDDN